MDKIQKALHKLSHKERRAIKELLTKIKNGQLHGLDIQKLIGNKDIYRIRKGSVRIIFRQTKSAAFILAIERRWEKTYRNF